MMKKKSFLDMLADVLIWSPFPKRRAFRRKLLEELDSADAEMVTRHPVK